MKIHKRRGLSVVVLVVAQAASSFLALAACQVDAAGHFETLTEGTFGPDSGGGGVPSDSGADGTGGFPPDATPCGFQPACEDDAECCGAPQPPTVLVANACPEGGFPGNPVCVNEVCEPSDCVEHTDCTKIMPSYVCVVANGVGRCAPNCDGDDDFCQDLHNLPDSFTCETEGSVKYCAQSTI